MESSAASDETLLAKYVRGDVAAFEALYARHELPLWRFVLRLAGNRATAEDVVQDVWLKVAREAPRFRAGAPFPPWLFTIARHRVIDGQRARRDHAVLDDEAAHLQDDPAHQPPQEAEADEQGRAILAALQRLPEEQREAFVLQAESGMSVEEIATVTGTTFETAKSRLRYARDKLKALLRDYA